MNKRTDFAKPIFLDLKAIFQIKQNMELLFPITILVFSEFTKCKWILWQPASKMAPMIPASSHVYE